jgi:hypothetical protein
MDSTLVFMSDIRVLSSSSWSSTVSRLFDWLLEERHCSPMIRPAATVNKKPSASAFAPFSIALEVSLINIFELAGKGKYSTHRVSDNGRMCLAGSPRIPVRMRVSALYIRCAKLTQKVLNDSWLSAD